MSASELRIYSKLQAAAHLLAKKADQHLIDAAGVTTAQAALLASVSAVRKPTQREIADSLNLNESAVTAMVARLENLGYVIRKTDHTDRRAKTVYLSASGEHALKLAGAAFRGINQVLDDAIADSDVEEFSSVLIRIIERLR